MDLSVLFIALAFLSALGALWFAYGSRNEAMEASALARQMVRDMDLHWRERAASEVVVLLNAVLRNLEFRGLPETYGWNVNRVHYLDDPCLISRPYIVIFAEHAVESAGQIKALFVEINVHNVEKGLKVYAVTQLRPADEPTLVATIGLYDMYSLRSVVEEALKKIT